MTYCIVNEWFIYLVMWQDDGEYNILQNHVCNETFYLCNMFDFAMNEHKHEKVQYCSLQNHTNSNLHVNYTLIYYWSCIRK